MIGCVMTGREPRAMGDRGSAPVEFILVGVLLTLLTLGVLQFALAVHVKNIVTDAATDAAFYAALADTSPGETEARARAAIERGTGSDLVTTMYVFPGSHHGVDFVNVTIIARLPLLGLLGPAHGTQVTAHAPLEHAG